MDLGKPADLPYADGMTEDDPSDFYTGLAAEVWRAAHDDADTEAQADFAEEGLGLAPGARVLDVPCGPGRIALALARRGYRVTGVDRNAQFLAELTRAAQGQPHPVQALAVDMTDLPPDIGPFDAALCLGNSLPYLPPDGQAALAAGLARVTADGGRLLLHSELVAECLLPNLEERPWRQVGDIRMLVDNDYDADNGRLVSIYTFQRGTVEERRQLTAWVHTAGDLLRRFATAGFVVEASYGHWDGRPFGYADPMLLAVLVHRPPRRTPRRRPAVAGGAARRAPLGGRGRNR